MDYRSIANSYIRELTPYQPGKPIEELERELGIQSAIKLASNENPLGASRHAMLAAQHALEKMHYYPDGGCYELKHALAKFLKIDPAQLTIGNGSENILEIIAKAFLNPACAAVVSQYAFITIPLLIRSYGAEVIRVPANHYAHDIKKMITAVTSNTRIVYIVNPNNPTGTYTTEDDLILLLKSIPKHILVVVDEAYYEYINQQDYPNTLSLQNKFPNLIIVRTFSKAYGLAALRLGYAITSPEIADILNRARLPFNVNSIAAHAGLAALEDQDHVAKTIALNNDGMRYIKENLDKLNIKYIPSLGNFISINMTKNAGDIYQKLLHKGVIIRPLLAYEMQTYCRVTIGTEEQNKRFLDALQDVL